MTATNRLFSWRQGDVPTGEAAKTLGLQQSENADNTFVVVVSHDCDPVSNSAITVAEREMLKQWRLEHMSLQDDPQQPMITP